MIALVDGIPSDVIAVTDSSVLRGDGCFESIRSYGGNLFALGWHLDRLARSADMLDMQVPNRGAVAEWCRHVAAAGGDGVVRVLLTRGDAIGGVDSVSRCVVMHVPLPAPRDEVTLALIPAPWHPAGRVSELAGAKTLSYAPNLAATRSAQARGFDDALLVGDEGVVLEGPTFSVAWVVNDVIETPTLDLFVLDSITRRTMIELARADGIQVNQGTFTVDRLEAASEVMALSTVKEVTPVTAVGDARFDVGRVSKRLASRFADAVAARWGD